MNDFIQNKVKEFKEKEREYLFGERKESHNEFLEQFLISALKEQQDRLSGEVEGLRKKETEYEAVAQMSLSVPTGRIVNGEVEMEKTVEQGKKYKHQTILDEEEIAFNKGIDQATSIIKELASMANKRKYKKPK